MWLAGWWMSLSNVVHKTRYEESGLQNPGAHRHSFLCRLAQSVNVINDKYHCRRHSMIVIMVIKIEQWYTWLVSGRHLVRIWAGIPAVFLMSHGFPLHTCFDWNLRYKCILLAPIDDTAEEYGPDPIWTAIHTTDLNIQCHKLEVSTTNCNKNNFTSYKSYWRTKPRNKYR